MNERGYLLAKEMTRRPPGEPAALNPFIGEHDPPIRAGARPYRIWTNEWKKAGPQPLLRPVLTLHRSSGKAELAPTGAHPEPGRRVCDIRGYFCSWIHI
jgi:hypothetical protein